MKPLLSIFLFLLAFSCLLFFGACDSDYDSDDDIADDDIADDDTGDDDTAYDDDIADDDAVDDDADDDDNEIVFDPAQPGQFQVGNKTLLFVDTSRGDPATATHRTLLTEVWYPASDEAADMPRDIIRNFLGGWDEEILARLAEEGATEEDLENFDNETGSARDAPIRTSDAPYPMIVFSHGLAGVRFQSFTLFEYLASHGFIVIAPDHTGGALATPLPDGVVEFIEELVPISYWQRKKDLSFLISTFTELSADDPDEFFTGMIDARKVGAMGHSFGGTVAVETTKDDSRILAAINFASFMFPWFTDPFDASLMFMIAIEDDTMGDATFLMRYDYFISPAPKFKVELFDAGHYTFTDTCILIPSLMGDGDGCGLGERRWTGEEFAFIEHDEAFAIINPYVTAFFGFNLRGGQEHMAQYLSENHFSEKMYYEYKFR